MGTGVNIWFCIGFIIIVLGFTNLIIAEKQVIKDKCYDGRDNIISGQICDKTILLEPYNTFDIILINLFLFNIFGTPLILISIQSYLDRRDKLPRNRI